MSEVDLEQEDRAAERRNESDKDRRQQTKTDLAWVMSTRQGRRFIARMLGNVELPVFNSNGSTMTHAEGRRSVGIELLAELKMHHREAWLQLVNETTPKA
jgi:hypothetical protein